MRQYNLDIFLGFHYFVCCLELFLSFAFCPSSSCLNPFFSPTYHSRSSNLSASSSLHVFSICYFSFLPALSPSLHFFTILNAALSMLSLPLAKPANKSCSFIKICGPFLCMPSPEHCFPSQSSSTCA